jgi:CBS domain-containing protein
MQARDVMSAPAITVGPRTNLQSLVGTMLGLKLSGLPVVDESGRLIGVISEGDLLRRAELGTERKRSSWIDFILGPGRSATDYVRANGRMVEELMTPDPVAVAEDTPLEEIVTLMESRHIKRVPVLRDGRVVGIVTRADLLRALFPLEAAAPEAATSDAEIQKNILAEIAARKWAPPDAIRVGVDQGRVTLTGTILVERARAALLVCAENQPGVVAVKDEIVWVDPASGAFMGPPGEASVAF